MPSKMNLRLFLVGLFVCHTVALCFLDILRLSVFGLLIMESARHMQDHWDVYQKVPQLPNFSRSRDEMLKANFHLETSFHTF